MKHDRRGYSNDILGLANRLRVFRALRAFMDQWNRCPQPIEIAAEVGLSGATVARHMHALDGADGLKFPVRAFADRRHADKSEAFHGNITGMGAHDPYTAELDVLMGTGR